MTHNWNVIGGIILKVPNEMCGDVFLCCVHLTQDMDQL